MVCCVKPLPKPQRESKEDFYMAKRGMLSGMAVLLMTAACGNTDVNLGKRPLFSNGTNVVTVFAYHGISGAPVTNATLTMRIGPNILTAKAQDNAYTFTNVPTSNYPIYATAQGYLDFSGTTGALGGGGTLAQPNYQMFNLLMFPNTDVASSLTVKVFDHQGAPVPTGQVVSSLTDNPDIQFWDGLANKLNGSYGYRPAVKVYTLDANGTATVPNTDLVAGATYELKVFAARNAGGDFLGASTPATANYVPNESHEQINFFLGAPTAASPIVVRTSNGQPNGTTPVAPVADGTFTIYFAEPVEPCNAAGVHDFYDVTVGAATKQTDVNTDNVTWTLPADGLSITMKPNFFDPPATGQALLEVAFKNVQVQVKGTTNCQAIAGMRYFGLGSQPFVDLHVVLQDN